MQKAMSQVVALLQAGHGEARKKRGEYREGTNETEIERGRFEN